MEKILEHNNDHGSFHLYQYNQNSNELLENVQLSVSDQEKINSFSSKKRKKEWLAVRHLVNILHLGQNIQLVYDENGKPFLNNGTKISISHSDNFVAIALSKYHEIGIDIQYFKEKIQNIQSRFLHHKEQDFIQLKNEEEQLQFLHYYWTAKEAIYKTISVAGTIFTEIDCSDFKSEKKENWMATYRGEIFTLYSLKLGQLFLSFSHFADLEQ